MNSSKKIGLGILVALVLLFSGVTISTYNSIISLQEKVTSSYYDIDTQLQRRADLIPNLINSVKGYMQHEQGIINSITESRERLMKADNMQERAQASEELSAALGQLNVIVENYPNLKADQNFIQLQDELAGTENRIATTRRDYNQAVNAYNTKIRRFPAVFIARIFGFEKEDYFEAAPGSNEVPNVSFE